MGQVIDHAVLVCERNGQQQLGIISGRLEQLRQDLVQHDLVIRPKRRAEVFDQYGILPKHLFRHGGILLVKLSVFLILA